MVLQGGRLCKFNKLNGLCYLLSEQETHTWRPLAARCRQVRRTPGPEYPGRHVGRQGCLDGGPDVSCRF